MCGIAGVARVDGSLLTEDAQSLLSDLVHLLSHRGPDDQRMMREDQVGLAFTRLSLVDPQGGGQPLISEDGSVVLIANGEIYNHAELAACLPAGTRLRTRSDCEVLLNLYQRDGIRFLDRVNGMFALVLWDRRANRLLFCRDRFGIKPLFYHRNRQRIVFASEIKALFADPATPRRLSWERALEDQGLNLAPAFTHAPVNTWFDEIELVPAATILEIDLSGGQTRSHRYWRLPTPHDDSDASDHDYIDRYRELLSESVKDCVMADAEIGLFLSGGIDSAAVAALAGTDSLHTFTALMGSTVVNGDAEWGHRAAKALGLPNHQVLFPPDRVPGVDEWKRLLWLSETPQCSPEVFYKYEMHRYVRAHRPDIKGMLLGAAADEFNGGYAAGYAEGGDWETFVNNIGGMARRQALQRRPELAQWWEYSDLPLINDSVLRPPGASGDQDVYAAYLAWNYRNIQQYNVWHEDRTAAGNGIEARVPFLDHRLVELVTSIPTTRRRDLLWDKQILRLAMEGILPPDLIKRPKIPFFHGDGERHTYHIFCQMLTQDGDALLEQALSSARAKEFLHCDGMRQMLRRFQANPNSRTLEMLLRLVNLGLLDLMTADLPPAPSAGPFATTPPSIEVCDWDRQAAQLHRSVLKNDRIDKGTVLTLTRNVLLTSASSEPGVWYLVIDGSLEYVLDESEDRNWPNVLRAIDGTRTLGEVLTFTGCSLDQVERYLRQSLEWGILVAVEGVTA